MSPNGWFRRLQRGVVARGVWNSWLTVLVGAVSPLGVLDILVGVGLLSAPPPGWFLFAVGVSGVLWTFNSLRLPAATKLRLASGRTEVTIEEGDLLDSGSHLAISVNEFFDHEVGERIAPTSLHGQVIQRLFNGDAGRFRTAVDQALAAAPRDDTRRNNLGLPAFPIGTVAVVPHGTRKLFLVALTHTNIETHKATADTRDLQEALNETWRQVRIFGNGMPLAVPLFGHGLAGVPGSASSLLHCLIGSLAAASLVGPVAPEVRVVLRDSVAAQVNLRHHVGPY